MLAVGGAKTSLSIKQTSSNRCMLPPRVKNGEVCGPGCQCVNCKNAEERQETQKVDNMEDMHYDTLQDDIGTIMQNIFGSQESDFTDDSESSEGGDTCSSSDVDELSASPNPEIDDQ